MMSVNINFIMGILFHDAYDRKIYILKLKHL